MNLADLIEAAVRSDDLSTAEAALSRLSERAQASQTPWSLGLLARGRALMAPDEDAETLFLESLEQLGRSGVMTDFARTRLLYGEWLRRQRRRREAREQLRAAYEMFLNLGAGVFARRAESELLATGEHASAPTPSRAICARCTPSSASDHATTWSRPSPTRDPSSAAAGPVFGPPVVRSPPAATRWHGLREHADA